MSSVHADQLKKDMLALYREAVFAGMTMEEVQYKVQVLAQAVEAAPPTTNPSSVTRNRLRTIIPIIFVTLGSIMIANAVWPIMSYALFVSPQLQRISLVAPVPADQILTEADTDMVSPVAMVSATPAPHVDVQRVVKPIILSQQLDYTNLANWFIDTESVQPSNQEEEVYYVDIPSLDIERAEVRMGGTDLNESLIQYPGTAEPGDYGAPVIFGHSVLRQFYRPDIKNPNRYKSIFSKIMTMKKGELIYIEHEGVKYTYRVKDKHEVQPEDTFILEQRHRHRELKLITCVPEGTYLRRGVIVAELVESGE